MRIGRHADRDRIWEDCEQSQQPCPSMRQAGSCWQPHDGRGTADRRYKCVNAYTLPRRRSLNNCRSASDRIVMDADSQHTSRSCCSSILWPVRSPAFVVLISSSLYTRRKRSNFSVSRAVTGNCIPDSFNWLSEFFLSSDESHASIVLNHSQTCHSPYRIQNQNHLTQVVQQLMQNRDTCSVSDRGPIHISMECNPF